MTRRTKVVCTLGPAVDSKSAIRDLIKAGMDVARLNLSHGDWETRRKWIAWIRELSAECAPVSVLADLQGPKFRVGALPEGHVDLIAGHFTTIGVGPVQLPVGQKQILKGFARGAHVLIADGSVELKLGEPQGDGWSAKVVSGGTVKSRQGLTVVGTSFDAPSLTPKDREDIALALDAGVDFIALSYVRSARDIDALRKIVDARDPTVRLCAKIETRAALENLEEIAAKVDVLMVARGDLGLQMPFEEVPHAQKRIIAHCAKIGKPVITATQMLESMITNPRPTRAEATDVANAVLDGSDALMLSGETASGAHPIACVRTMLRIADSAEPFLDRARFEENFYERAEFGVNHSEAVAHAVAQLALLIKPKAILMTSASGQTPRLVSKFRPEAPLLCVTWSKRVQAQLSVVWGLEAITLPQAKDTDQAIADSVKAFVKLGRLKKGDLVIITAGIPIGTPGHTNLILTQVI